MTSSNALSFHILINALEEIEAELLAQEGELVPSVLNLARLSQSLSKTQELGSLDHTCVDQLRKAAKRIELISGAWLRLEEVCSQLKPEIKEGAMRIMCKEAETLRQCTSPDLCETLPSYRMRKHFLEHLDSPYPSQEDKEAVVQATNESATRSKTSSEIRQSLQVHQLTLWFINARRRSGWSHILRKFARNDRQRMKLLMQAKMRSCDMAIHDDPLPASCSPSLDDILRDNLGRLTDADKEEFEDDWARMISWIKYGVKDKVGDWVYDLVAASKKSHKPGQPRTVTTAANRSPARKTTATSRPKRSKQRPSTTPSTDSHDSHSALESTPELSMCSTADTSFSSFGSNISLLQYSPFQQDEAQLSPTLHAAATRKVKALPKRVPKTHFQDEDESVTREIPPAKHSGPAAFDQLAPYTLASAQAIATPTQQFYPLYDALAPVSAPFIRRRESLTSNSLSAAFG